MRRFLSALALSLAALPAFAAPTIPLVSGAPQNFSLPGNSFTNSFFIDVGANDTQLTLALTGASGDVDLLLRYGSPFPDSGPVGAPDVEHLFEVAQYRSTSATAAESIAIGRSNVFPVRAGRWFVSVVSFNPAATNVTLQATLAGGSEPNLPIEVVFDDTSGGCQTAPWNDPASRSPVGGNNGTTLGQQRRNAILEAVRILSQSYRSPVPIRVQACWSTSQGPGESPQGVTLAASGPKFLVRNETVFDNDGSIATGLKAPFFPRNNTWYPNTLVGKLGGTRACKLYATQNQVDECTLTDFGIDFNLKVDTEGRGFYYGFDSTGASAAGKADFVTVATHEMTHGLGFISTVEVDADNGTVGAKLEGLDDAFSTNIVDVREDGSIERFMDSTNAEREFALSQFTQLRWDDPEAVTSTLNSFRGLPAPDNLIKMYTTTPIQPGSTLSHIGFANAPELMNPTVNNGLRITGLSTPMLNAVGWSDAARALPSGALPRSTQYFDPAHPGHGIDVEYAGGDIYVVIFYTYGANGEPEWYLAQGSMVDNVFVPQANANGDTLVRYKYVQGGNPPQVPDANVRGQVRLDFNQSASAPACRDGVGRDGSSPLVVMTWSIGADRNQQWCMQSLIPTSLRTSPDFTGSWYAGADSGWGFSLLGIRNGQQNGLFGLLYYPDSQGNGRWAYLQTGGSTTALTLKERRGYCRTCPVPANVQQGQFNDVDAGTITLTLTTPSGEASAGNKVTLNVNYQTAPNGNFARTNSPLILLSVPQQ